MSMLAKSYKGMIGISRALALYVSATSAYHRNFTSIAASALIECDVGVTATITPRKRLVSILTAE